MNLEIILPKLSIAEFINQLRIAQASDRHRTYPSFLTFREEIKMSHKIFRWFVSLMLGLAMIAITSVPRPAYAVGPWYVMPTGDDNNDCLGPSTPCATIDSAIGKAADGDIIKVAIGAYTSNDYYAAVTINKSITLSGGWNAAFTSQSGISIIDGQKARKGILVLPGTTVTNVDRFLIQNGFSIDFQGGGGIYNNGSLTLNNSVIRSNTTFCGGCNGYWGGGIFNDNGNLTINNSTLSGNSTYAGGGGIYNKSGTLTLNNVTLNANITSASGGGILNNGGIVTLRNSIVSGNTAYDGADCSGAVGSAGYNLIGDTSNCDFTLNNGDLIDIDPKLGQLIGPSGIPSYHPLLSGSPAIDAGNPTGCTDQNGNLLTTDQRGVARVGTCDIGAYEYTTPGPAASLSVISGNGQHALTTFPFSTPLQAVALDSQGSPVSGVTIDFTAPASGASGTFADTGANITSVNTDASGVATAPIFTANNIFGTYTVSASMAGLESVNFSLENAGWFVAPTGNDTNSCSQPDSPCATINGALSKPDFVAGNTILVAIGTYTGTGNEVVLIDKDATLSGGWDANFTTQNGMSKIDGQNARRGITATAVTASLSHLIVKNADTVAIYQGGAALDISNSSIQNSGNAGLFVGCCGNVTVNNTTIANNKGTGIVNDQGSLSLNNTSISNNMGGITNFGGSVSISNSILAGNTPSPGIGQDCAGIFTSGGNNIVGNTTGCTISATSGDQFDIDPKLGTFLPEQGYDPLLSDSPAINAGNSATCPPADQRGVARIGACDIGSYEYTIPGPATNLSLVGGSGQLTETTSSFSNPLQAAALDSQGSPVSGVTIDFMAPVSGPSGTFADMGINTTTVDTDAGGVATTSTFTANDQAGAYTVSASASGLGSVNFSLEQIVRPANDNFANAKFITSLPFSETVDITNATNEPNEPQNCYSMPNTVWYSFTPTETIGVRVDIQGSAISSNMNVYSTSNLSFLGCTIYYGPITFLAEAEQTYYFQAGGINGEVGSIQINLEQVPPPANDNFANATVILSPLPFDDTVDTLAATLEASESTPSCASNGLSNTVWYAFTPNSTESISASNTASSFNPVLAVYMGNELANLTEVGCRMGGYPLTFHAEAGNTYYFQAGMENDSGAAGPMQFHLEVTLPPQVGFYFNPSDPSIFDSMAFYDFTSDPGQAGIQSYTWNFGDGTTATGSYANHQYARDGDYTVQHSVTTVDGRTASTSQVIHVRTHDVGITKVTAPKSANSGQTKAITVSLRNTRYPETVTVDLYKSTSGGDVWIGSLTLQVPLLSGNKTKQFTFNYTFTPQDAQIGKVTFRAVATIDGARDVFPQDNIGISSPPTKVSR